MSTTLAVSQSGNTAVVKATSTLSAPVFYNWYIDGAFVAQNRSGVYTFVLNTGEQVLIECLDANTSAAPTPPAGYPATRTLEWVRSTGDVSRYQVQQNENSAGWVTIGYVQDDPQVWDYQFTTNMLDDLSVYQWQVIPLDAAGNAGAALSLGSETIVRTPNAPPFTFSFNAGTTKVTFAA